MKKKKAAIAAHLALLVSAAHAVQEPHWTLAGIEKEKGYWFYDAASVERSSGGGVAMWVALFEAMSFTALMHTDPRVEQLDATTDITERVRLITAIAETVVKHAGPPPAFRFEFDCKGAARLLENPGDKSGDRYPTPWNGIKPNSHFAKIEADVCK
jgi:hypothetical protein